MPMSPTKLMVRVKTSAKGPAMREGEASGDNESIMFVEKEAEESNPWDEAHHVVHDNPEFTFAEPELESSQDFYREYEEITEKGEATAESYLQFIDYWPHPQKSSIWHLGKDFSQLKDARDAIKNLPKKKVVRIAHFDTGYDKDHISFPKQIIRKDLERNFVDGEEDRWNNAEDLFSDGALKMPGHGTGTLSILAGAKVAIDSCGFDDFIGLHDSIEIVPIRLAKSVVLFKSGAFVKALDYVVNELYNDENKRVHVVTMSMGGLASRAWADMVNAAYEKGIFIVTAAGNNFKKLPTRTMVFPARFNRVVAACGVTADLSPYSKPSGEGSFSIMEGNYGPRSLMKTAIAAFTPNVPWATHRFDKVVGIRGDGTSSATPQVASAAALYYIKHYEKLEALPEPWMRVEAIRHALFNSAQKTITDRDGDYEMYYGNGILKANDMLNVDVPTPEKLVKQEEDKVSFPFIKMILGLKGLSPEEDAEEEMLETELMQLVLTDEQMQYLLNDEEKRLEDLSTDEKMRLAEFVINNEKASQKLKEKMGLLLIQLSI